MTDSSTPPASDSTPPSYPQGFWDWCEMACRRSVALRGLKFAVVVGAVLIAINHGDAILRGELGPSNYWKMALTVMVPYVVSVLSSVGAMAEGAARRGGGSGAGRAE